MFFIYIIAFIGASLFILLGSHYLAYLSIIYFMGFNDPFIQSILFWLFMILSVSFILATLLTLVKENRFTRVIYFLAGYWMGFFVNLMLGIIALWIINDIFSYFHLAIDNVFLGEMFFILVTFYSLYGAWNARHPKIKRISVKIPNLPKPWKGKKIIQLSDIHIGHINRREFVNDVLKKVNSINSEMVVITGDVFDGMDGDTESPVKLINGIKTKKGVYFVTGNHETYLGTDEVKKHLERTKVIFLKDEVKDVDGVKLIGLGYPDRNEKKDMLKVLEGLKNQFFGHPNILLYHTPVNIKAIEKLGVNLELCGHTHRGQIFPFDIIAKILYRGYDYGIHKKGDYTLYITSGTGSWGPPMRTGSIPEIVEITLR